MSKTVTDNEFLLISDLHFGVKRNINFYEYQNKTFENIFNIMDKRNIKDIVISGDVFDNRNSIEFKALKQFKEKFLKEKYNYIIILGNHDVKFRTTNSMNSIDLLLSDYKNVKIINKPTVLYDNYLCVPWINDENYNLIDKTIKDSTKEKFLIGHFELSGFQLMRGIYSEHSQFKNQNILLKFDQVFSGHFHIHSQKNNITYLGSPYQLNSSDIEQEKYFFIMDKNGIKEKIKNENTYYIQYFLNNERDFLNEIENNIDYYKNKFLKLSINIKKTIDIETGIFKLSEVCDDLSIKNNFLMNYDNNVDIDFNNTNNVFDNFKKWVNEQSSDILTQKEKSQIIKIFKNKYIIIHKGEHKNE